jgi:uncharacterized Fe-S cluster-containing radical SAM superfamily protein
MEIKFTAHCVSWYAAAALIHDVRVAACENGLIDANERLIDVVDKSSRHAIVISTSGKLLGCARLTTKGQIDRIVILYHSSHDRIKTALIEILSDYAQITRMEVPIVIDRINGDDDSMKLAA